VAAWLVKLCSTELAEAPQTAREWLYTVRRTTYGRGSEETLHAMTRCSCRSSGFRQSRPLLEKAGAPLGECCGLIWRLYVVLGMSDGSLLSLVVGIVQLTGAVTNSASVRVQQVPPGLAN
jgi:hypothetical protein